MGKIYCAMSKEIKIKIPEREIQKTIIDYLSVMEKMGGLYFVRVGSGAIHTAEGRYFKSGKAGAPDIIVLYKGKYVALEVKTESGKLSSDQLKTKEMIIKCGGDYQVVRSLDDVFKLIN